MASKDSLCKLMEEWMSKKAGTIMGLRPEALVLMEMREWFDSFLQGCKYFVQIVEEHS